MSELILTCVPGVATGPDGALLRVVLTPRLTGDPAMRDADPQLWRSVADHGLGDWPSLLRGARFDVDLLGAEGAFSAPDVEVRSVAQSHIWAAFFDQVTVRPTAGQPTYPTVSVSPTAADADQVDGIYRTATADALARPEAVAEQLDALRLAPLPPPPDLDAPIPAFRPPDFHQVVAMMREHPAVLRALGLLVELTVPRVAFDQVGDGGEIRVRWPGAPAMFDRVASPRTSWAREGGRFLAAGAGLVSRGLVDLQPDRWAVRAFDVDGAASRLAEAQAGAGATMPALRTAGLQLMHRNRQEWFAQRAARATGNANRTLDDAPPLTAEDLVLGYRLDVRFPGDAWFSVMRRRATYTVNGLPIGPADSAEEGHVKPAAAVKGGDELRADEVVVRWDGHPLAVPRVSPDGAASTAQADPRMPYRFEWVHAPDLSQGPAPELRFGERYQMRLRVVDIAGGGLEVGDVPGDVGATLTEPYGRYEPVPPPEMPPPPGLMQPGPAADSAPVVDETVLGPGGSLERLVVRSDPMADAATAPIGAYPSNDARTLLPPAARFDVIERHGLLSGDDMDTWRVARRALAAPRGTADARNARMYTWVPDPLARGVSITAAPLSARLAASRPNLVVWGPDGAWPDFEHKTVRIEPGPALDVVWRSQRDAVVTLPPAMRATLEIASFVAAADAPQFAAHEWMASVPAAVAALSNGRHPVITPSRRIELVHAVRRPLAKPGGTLRAARAEGDTFALLGDPDAPLLNIDRDSTQQVEVVASWSEWVRGPAGQQPERAHRVLGAIAVGLDDPALAPIHHEFADTKHRAVTYELTARSRFRDHFAASEPEAAFEQHAQLPVVHVPSSARPVPLAVAAVIPAFTWALVDLNAPAPTGPFPEDEPPAPIMLPRWQLTREGGRLRIELDGDWFSTGEGEELGVVVQPGPAAPGEFGPGVAIDTLADSGGGTAHLVTTVHRDPVFASGVPPLQPDHTMMTGASGPPCVVADRESGTSLLVVPFAPTHVDGRWFADIGLGQIADNSYCPQVRLSLVRLQQHSLPGLEASLLCKPDLVTLLPSRRLIVDRAVPVPTVTLEGTGPAGAPNVVEVRLEQAPAGTAIGGLTSLDGGISGTWTVSGRFLSTLGEPIEVPVPDDGMDHRIVVREFESISPSPLPVTDRLHQEQSGRVVFAGTLAV